MAANVDDSSDDEDDDKRPTPATTSSSSTAAVKKEKKEQERVIELVGEDSEEDWSDGWTIWSYDGWNICETICETKRIHSSRIKEIH